MEITITEAHIKHGNDIGEFVEYCSVNLLCFRGTVNRCGLRHELSIHQKNYYEKPCLANTERERIEWRSPALYKFLQECLQNVLPSYSIAERKSFMSIALNFIATASSAISLKNEKRVPFVSPEAVDRIRLKINEPTELLNKAYEELKDLNALWFESFAEEIIKKAGLNGRSWGMVLQVVNLILEGIKPIRPGPLEETELKAIQDFFFLERIGGLL